MPTVDNGVCSGNNLPSATTTTTIKCIVPANRIFDLTYLTTHVVLNLVQVQQSIKNCPLSLAQSQVKCIVFRDVLYNLYTNCTL